MGKSNGKPFQSSELDMDHELTAGHGSDDVRVEGPSAEAEQPATGADDVQALRAERDALLDRLARSQAEFDNYRKRSTREQQDFRQYALADALKSLLPVLDSFDLALKNAPRSSDGGGLRGGLELIHKQFQDALAKLGVREIEAAGRPFDPQWHQAVEMVETDEAGDNQVLQELQRGYKLKDRLLRPAMVRVARDPRK
jgi:molecular chaperone GrpE